MIHRALFACLLWASGSLKAQVPETTSIRSFWTAGANLGGIWAHNDPVKHLAQSHPVQVYAEFLKKNPGRDWNRNYRDAAFGMGFYYLNYRSQVLGQSLAWISFLEPGISGRLSFRMGTGLVYNHNPFNLNSNTTNLMLGSAFAAVLHGQVNWSFLRQNKPWIRFGIGLTHFSNGAFTQPNSGINLFYFSTGYTLGYKNKSLQNPPPEQPTPERRFHLSLSASLSFVENFPIGGAKHPVAQLQLRGRYRSGNRSGFHIGLDLMYNEGVAARIRDFPSEGSQALCLGLPVGHELILSRKLSLLTECGLYLIKRHNLHPSLYQRYGIRHIWWKGAYSAVYLKTHRAKAECIEFNLGYQI